MPKSDGIDRTMSVKIGECECSAEEEDWTLIESPCGGAPVATYKCQTCGEIQSY